MVVRMLDQPTDKPIERQGIRSYVYDLTMLIFDPLFPKTDTVGKVAFARSQKQSLRCQPLSQQCFFICSLRFSKLMQGVPSPRFHPPRVDLCGQNGGGIPVREGVLVEE